MAAPLEQLPGDVLRYIFEFVPPRPRWLVVAFVSRRFKLICRQCAVEVSLASGPRGIPAGQMYKAQMLNNITALDEWDFSSQLLFSTERLQHIRYFSHYNLKAQHEVTQKIPTSLQSIDLVSCPSDKMTVILAQLPPTISTLAVHNCNAHSLRRFTSLTKLTLGAPLLPEDADIYRQIFPSVTALTWANPQPCLPLWLLDCVFTNLRRLELVAVKPENVVPYLRTFPRLESLACPFVDNLTSPYSPIAALTQLSHLALELNDTANRTSHSVLAMLPRLVSIRRTERSTYNYASLTTLTSLAAFESKLIFSLPMPYLRKLFLTEFIAADVGHILLLCPCLRYISIQVGNAFEESVVQALTRTVVLAERRGVETLVLYTISRSRKLVELCARHKWLRILLKGN